MKESGDMERMDKRKDPQMCRLSDYLNDYLNENMKTMENSTYKSGKEPEKKIDLRKVWKDEARNFTPWLANRLDELGECLEIGMELVETESPVGNLSADILARETGTGRKIIIENQLETTDHDHLGKMITYASGKEAGICIWIVGGYNDEHRKAIKWLNRNMGNKCLFFLVEVEVVEIYKEYTWKFEVVERPVGWHLNGGNNELKGCRVFYRREP